MGQKVATHLRTNWVAWLAIGLLAAGSGGAAYALQGKNRVRSDDIKNGAVKLRDLAPRARPKPSPVRSLSYSGRATDAASARHALVTVNGVTLSARCDTSNHSGATVYLFARNRSSRSVRIGDWALEDLGLNENSGAETVSVAAGAEKELDADQSTDLHLTGSDAGFELPAHAQVTIRNGARVATVDLHVHANGLVNPGTCELFGTASSG